MRRYLTSILLALGLCAPVQAAGLVEIALAGSVFSYGDVAFVGATASDPQAALDAYIESLSPTLWIAARKETVYADTDAVPTATDWSGNGYDATQGTASAQPTYVADGIGGLPTFSFDGSTDYLQSTGWTNTQPITVVVVASFSNTDTSLRAAVGNISGGQGVQIRSNSGRWEIWSQSTLTGSTDDALPHVFVAYYNGAGSVLQLDGASDASGNTGVYNSNGCEIGGVAGSFLWDGNISEVIFIDSDTTSDQRNVLSVLAGAAYAIGISIP